MEIRDYTLRDLREALERGTLWDTRVVPITRHRALSQINNPRAADDDVLLMTAVEDGDLVAYLGVVPDILFVEGMERKFGWLSCWWADPSKKHLHAAGALYRRSFELYENAVAAASYTDDAGRIYEASKRFIPFHDIPRCASLLRMAAGTLLPARKPGLKRISGVLKFADAVINPFVAVRLHAYRRALRRECARLRFECINAIDEEAEACILRNQGREFTRRGKKEFNWILRYPWVLPAPLRDENAERYSFLHCETV